ncbi:hypothetical protein [Sphingomonas sp. DC2300-3]|uniref:hypothetical protein n=1 Tax=unclassified Sphingomonas TaxID=196159 RepID=UPI003CE85412
MAKSLEQAGERFLTQWKAHGWQTTVNMHANVNWMAPSMSADELYAEVADAATRVRSANSRKLPDAESKYLFRLKVRADAFNASQINSAFDAVTANLLELVNSVYRHVPPLPAPPPPPPKIDWEDLKKDRNLLPKDLFARLRAVDTRLKDIEPRSLEVGKKIADIEAAHETAEQLPTDLAELRDQKSELTALMKSASQAAETVSSEETRASDARQRIEAAERDAGRRIGDALGSADAMIRRSEQALRGATSAGLAKAFEARRSALAQSGMFWTFGLIAALGVALLVGWERLQSLKEVLNGGKEAATIWANAALAIFGIGAPVWFAWLATKQIGMTFRLAEDYAFKASVSQAYEGYRAEAVQVDEALRERLLISALTRIEEAPSRLLGPDHHSSPLSELLSNPAIRKSLEAVPGISEKIMALIPTKGGAAAAIIVPAAATAAVASAISGDDTKPEGSTP